MKFSQDVLLEIVDIVRDGLMNGVDISEKLRNIDVFVAYDTNKNEEVILLTPEYLKSTRG